MADFLTRIAQRALGVVPTVRPSIPSRYAPGAWTTPIDDEPFEVTVEPERAAPRPAIRAHRARPDPRPVHPGRPLPEGAVPEAAARPAGPARERSPEPFVPRPEAPVVSEPPAARQAEEVRPPEPAPHRGLVAAAVAPPPGAPPDGVPVSVPVPVPAGPRPTDETTLLPEEWDVPRAHRPQGPPRLSSPSRREPAAEAPPVRITIGRIDVRAVLPATAPAPRKDNDDRRRPAMTLEDYTRRRNRSER